MVRTEDLVEDRRGLGGYIHYSVAKRAGLRTGSTFIVDGTKFEVAEYVNYRPDVNRIFKGFRVKELD